MSSDTIDLSKLRQVVKQAAGNVDVQGREQASRLLRNVLVGATAGLPISYLLFNSATADAKKPYQFSSTLDVPAAKKHRKDREKKMLSSTPKLAEKAGSSFLGQPSSPDGHWLNIALNYAAPVTALMGTGAIGMNILQDSYRRNEQKKIDKAKKEYEKTLTELYKQSSAEDVQLEKAANIMHELVGGYVPLALLLGLGGYTAVDSAYKSNRDIVDKAIDERRRRSFRQQPTSLQAVTSNLEEPADAIE